MNREETLARLDNEKEWDLLVIGGGATGLGICLDAASRGYSTVLVEQSDFAKGTSSRSTKLIHGGVRYLEQGNITLVADALKERGRLVKNAPDLVTPLRIVIPLYHWWQVPYFGTGLKIYDHLSGRFSLGRSKVMGREKTLKEIPALKAEKLSGGVLFYDGQFDDSALATSLALHSSREGAAVLNYTQCTSFLKEDGKIRGGIVEDVLGGKQYQIRSRAVINAAGVFGDEVRQMDNPDNSNMIVPSQGAHVVLDQKFMPGEIAMLIPRTDDGRLLFAIPWKGKLLAGTTDIAVDTIELEPRPMEEEIDFILAHLGRILKQAPVRSDVLSAFAGLRPLLKSGKGTGTASLSRDHQVKIDDSGLVSVLGGKWTSYRKMAEDAVDKTARAHGLPKRKVKTLDYKLEAPDSMEPEEAEVESLHPAYLVSRQQVVDAVREEMACTLEDFLSRRIRLLLLDARAAVETAPAVAKIMAEELGKDQEWVDSQVEEFKTLAEGYM
jgi:glycerol-3-phosphate dehydrogenase